MKSTYNLAGLKKWSCKDKDLPPIANIKAIHVYDFDNTLFSSPLPNPQIWKAETIGFLQTYEGLAHGGWWHDSSILAATGDGLEKEETRAWDGCWNEAIVQLVEASMEQKDAVTVLLTGRNQTGFADLINRMCDAKKLDFDIVGLKPSVSVSGQHFESTMSYKQEFLRDLVFTYKNADEIRVYEDRPKHAKGFREYFERLNKSFLSHPVDQPPPPRKPITAEIIHVCELRSSLNPQSEIDVVQKAIHRHNEVVTSSGSNPNGGSPKLYKLQEHFIYFGYLISQTDAARLISLCNTPPNLIDSGEVRLLASSILISPMYPNQGIVKKVGGKGKKVTWQVTGIAKLEDRIWAARVAPVSESQVHTQDQVPHVVLAIRKGARPIDATKIQNWQPVPPEKAYMFETTVGDKVMLSIEQDAKGGNKSDNRNGVRGDRSDFKRKFNADNSTNHHGQRDDNSWAAKARDGGPNQRRNFHSGRNASGGFNNRNNRHINPGRRNDNKQDRDNTQNRGRGGLAGNANQRGRGGRGPNYKSLDDYGSGNFDGAGDSKAVANGGDMVMNY